MLKEAERIARDEFHVQRLAILSGTGARDYFRSEFDYCLQDAYMVKELVSPSPSLSRQGRGEQIAFARELRQKQTDAEKNLWVRLRNKQLEGIKFRRQQPVGPYIVDFANFERKLIIEIDGGQHNKSEARKRDEERATWLKEEGYQVLRFWNNEVLMNIEGVLERIRKSLR